MLKAGALIYAISISLIISIVSGSLILFSYFNSIGIETFSSKDRIAMNAMSGMNLLLSQKGEAFAGESRIDLFGEGRDAVTLQRKSWGAFEVLVSTAAFHNHAFTQMAIAGMGADEDTSMALYLADLDKPLSLCGKTIIRGTSYISDEGLKRAYIEGQNFEGSKMTDGLVKKSQKNIPLFNKSLTEKIQSYFTDSLQSQDSIINLSATEIPDSLSNPFTERTIWLYSQGNIDLKGKKLSGNIVILSERGIKIASDVHLEDVIVLAPKIEFEENFIGNAQVFSTDTIIIGENCRFNYPTVIGLIEKKNAVIYSSTIIIKEKTEITGDLFAFMEKPDEKKQMRISLNKNTIVTGHVYSSGFADLKGSVYGSVICNKLMLNTPSSVYENHLLNAVIDRTKLPAFFTGADMIAQSKSKKIVKWLY